MHRLKQQNNSCTTDIQQSLKMIGGCLLVFNQTISSALYHAPILIRFYRNEKMMRIGMLLLLSVGCTQSMAQQYTTAAGIRLGGDIGLSLQQQVANHVTVEAILQQRILRRQTTGTLLLQKHFPLAGRGFNLYAGAGPHIGHWGKRNPEAGTNNGLLYGATVLAGIELRLGRFLLSADYKPSINIKGGWQAFDSQTGLSARYIFIKRSRAAKKQRQPMHWPWQKKEV